MEQKNPINYVAGKRSDLGPYIRMVRNEKERYMQVEVLRKATNTQVGVLIERLKMKIPGIQYLSVLRMFRKQWADTEITSYLQLRSYINRILQRHAKVTLKFQW